MPVQIGAKPHAFSDPTGLLGDCHRRIEMFLGALEAAAAVLDRPPDAAARRGLDAALAYFREAAPKHNADEEASLFPRLRAISSAEMHSALAVLERLEREHRWADPLHAEIDRLGRRYLAMGELTPQEVVVFRESVGSLGRMYREHIGVEDSLVFPLAARLLDPAAKAEVAREMAVRRQLAGHAEAEPAPSLNRG